MPQNFPSPLTMKVCLIGRQVFPGNVERDTGSARVALHLGGVGTVFGLGPGLDRAFGERQRLVGDHQVEIEVDGVAEALAARTGAVGIVEGEQARLGLFIANVAVLALEALGETQVLDRFVFARSGFE